MSAARLVCGFVMSAALLAGAPPSASATVDVFTVTSKADPGDGTCDDVCTLREAVAASEDGDTTDVDRITFEPGLSGTITLDGTSLPSVFEGLSIEGPGADQLKVSAADSSLLFVFGNANHTERGDVTISGLHLADGQLWVFVEEPGSVTVRNAALSSAPTSAIYAVGSIEIENSTISGSGSPNGVGGGINWEPRTYESDPHLTIDQSTIANNSTEFAGGVFAASGAGAGRVEITNSTISGNSGGGIVFFPSQHPLSLVNTIVADNTRAGVPYDIESAGGPVDARFSLIEGPLNGTVHETVPGSNLLGVDPQLGPLQNNGGPSATKLPAPTSPVVDAGITGGGPTDQRGQPRLFDIPWLANSSAAGGNGTDIGAVELTAAEGPSQPPPPPPPPSRYCGFATNSITGSTNDDVLMGTGKNDVILALRGDDTAIGRRGADCLYGAQGADHLVGQDGLDFLFGKGGPDVLKGNKGNDELRGGPGSDRIIGGKGDDSISCGPGEDTVIGSRSRDSIGANCERVVHR